MNRLRLIAPLVLFAAPAGAADRTAFVSDFDRVRVEGPFEVHVMTRAAPAARIAGAGAGDGVDVRVESGTAVVRAGPRGGGGVPIVYLRTTNLRGATVIGGGKLDIAGPLRAQRVDVQVSGGGSLSAPAIDAESLTATLIGAGTLSLGGRGGQVRLLSSGAGTVDAATLQADDLVIRGGGSGPITARARYFADVMNIGLGAVTVLGSPKCKTRASGGGTIACGGSTAGP